MTRNQGFRSTTCQSRHLRRDPHVKSTSCMPRLACRSELSFDSFKTYPTGAESASRLTNHSRSLVALRAESRQATSSDLSYFILIVLASFAYRCPLKHCLARLSDLCEGLNKVDRNKIRIVRLTEALQCAEEGGQSVSSSRRLLDTRSSLHLKTPKKAARRYTQAARPRHGYPIITIYTRLLPPRLRKACFQKPGSRATALTRASLYPIVTPCMDFDSLVLDLLPSQHRPPISKLRRRLRYHRGLSLPR
jgi:hypothetical protein